jgi:hypothetical protein
LSDTAGDAHIFHRSPGLMPETQSIWIMEFGIAEPMDGKTSFWNLAIACKYLLVDFF